MRIKIIRTILLLMLINASIVYSQQTDSLREKSEKIPLLFLKTKLLLQMDQIQAGQYDLSSLNYSASLLGSYSSVHKSNLREALYLRYLFKSSKNSLGFWGNVLKYANISAATFLAAQHISKYGLFTEPKPRKK